jgi:hypothetical protein
MPALAQEKKEEHAGHGGEMDAMMTMWKEVSTPGEAHQKLNALVGKWNTESTMWMDPQNPMVSKGTAEIRWILGGRFLQQDMTGEMMGMPFTGTGVTGYDIYNMKYIGSWVDNSSTAMFTMEGTFDQSGKVLTMYGKMDEWMTGERDKNVKYVTRFTGPDSFAFEIHDLAIGEASTKVMQILYTRVK